jgi:flagellin
MAAEMTEFTKNQVLSNAGLAMASQANSLSQNVLQLLR